jgi:hypothetical protein
MNKHTHLATSHLAPHRHQPTLAPATLPDRKIHVTYVSNPLQLLRVSKDARGHTRSLSEALVSDHERLAKKGRTVRL